MDFNFEDEVRRADLESADGFTWSEPMARAWRAQRPKMATALDTYYGAAAGGMNLGAYMPTRGFRMNVQTYWGSEGIYDDPVPRIVEWCKGAQPSIPKSIIKPVARVSKNNSGAVLDMDVFVADCVKAGTTRLMARPSAAATGLRLMRTSVCKTSLWALPTRTPDLMPNPRAPEARGLTLEAASGS